MTTMIDKLRQLAQQKLAEGAALNLAADTLEQNGHVRAQGSLNGHLAKAIAIRRGRGRPKTKLQADFDDAVAATKPPTKKLASPRGAYRDAALAVLHQAKVPLSKAELHTRIQEYLGTPRTAAGFGSLVRYGYMKATKAGYVATGKAPAAD
jgi:hypothetical protein